MPDIWAAKSLVPIVQQICGLNFFLKFADLPQMRQFVDLRFADHIFLLIEDLRIGDPIIFSDMKLLQIDKYIIFLLTNTSLKVLTSDLRATFGTVSDRVTWHFVVYNMLM
jgi:hypothetical protein